MNIKEEDIQQAEETQQESLEDSSSAPSSEPTIPAVALSAEEIGLEQLLAYRGDLDTVPRPLGVIDSKLFLFDHNGLETFEARSGPARRFGSPNFDWMATFPNTSHLGHPKTFNFDSLAPQWVW